MATEFARPAKVRHLAVDRLTRGAEAALALVDVPQPGTGDPSGQV
ncbi:hypothetical protein [Sorangium sp. So ce1078]